MVRPTPLLTIAALFLLAASAAGRDVVSAELREAMASAAPGTRLSAYAVMGDQVPGAVLARQVAGLRGRPRRAAVAQLLRAHAAHSQAAARALLDEAVQAGDAGAIEVLWMGNALLFEAEAPVIEELARQAGIDRIRLVVDHGAAVYQDAAAGGTSYPFVDGFESGVLQPAWAVAASGAGTATVTALDGPVGNFHLELDSASSGTDSTVSVTLTLDLTGEKDVGLRFKHKEFSDEDHAEDGVFLSDDGTTWVKAASLNGGSVVYETHSIELDPIVAEAGLSYGPQFRVRFQWRDDFAIPTDGFAFDDVELAPGVGVPPPATPEPNLTALQATELWALGIDGSGVLVGTIDSGVWISHPDLVNRIWQNPGEVPGNALDDDGNGKVDDLHGWDFIGNNADVTAADPHGTQTAGIVCGDGSSGEKMTGMAPGATLLVCEVSTEAHYWAAQQYCLDAGVDCITSSYSYKWPQIPKPDYHMHRQLCDVELAAGIVHANSIGNQGNLLSNYPVPFNIAAPGNCPSPFDHPALADGGRSSVIACGGIELPADALYFASGVGPAAWENMAVYTTGYTWPQLPAYWDYPKGGFSGPLPGLVKPDVVAYTTNIQTTTIGSGYSPFGGTSAATPHVGGALCLLLDSQPAAEPRHVAAALELTAKDLGAPGKDNLYGSGKIQVKAAARRLVVLGSFSDTEPDLGDDVLLDLHGPANTTVFWLASLGLADGASDFELAPPFFLLTGFALGPSGQTVVPLAIPNEPLLAGLSLWSQFTAKGGAPQWGSQRFWSVPEELSIE
jgi:subtilisin family serine protease